MQSLNDTDNHVTLAVAECFAIVQTALEDHRRDILRHVFLFGKPLQTFDGWGEDVVFDLGMLAQPLLIVIDVVEGGSHFVVAVGVGRQILNHHEFQFAQLLVGTVVMLREGVDVVVVHGTAVQE